MLCKRSPFVEPSRLPKAKTKIMPRWSRWTMNRRNGEAKLKGSCSGEADRKRWLDVTTEVMTPPLKKLAKSTLSWIQLDVNPKEGPRGPAKEIETMELRDRIIEGMSKKFEHEMLCLTSELYVSVINWTLNLKPKVNIVMLSPGTLKCCPWISVLMEQASSSWQNEMLFSMFNLSSNPTTVYGYRIML